MGCLDSCVFPWINIIMANFDTDKKIQDYLEMQKAWLDLDIITQEEYNAAVRDVKAGMIGYTATLKASGEALTKSLWDLGGTIASGKQGTAVYNDALKSGGEYLKNMVPPRWKKMGELLKGGIGAVVGFTSTLTEHTDKLFSTFQELSRTGLANGMQDTFTNLQSMGYTMAEIGQMQSLLKENSVALAQFGGTAAEGTKKLSALSKNIVYSDIGTGFMRMGMTVDTINKGIVNYVQLQRMTGQLGKQNAEEMTAGAAAYIDRQDQLTKLTGVSADEQQKILDTAYNETAWSARQIQLRARNDDLTAQRNEEILESLGTDKPEIAKQFKAFMTNTLRTDDARKFNRTYHEFVQAWQQGERDLPTLMGLMKKGAARTSIEQINSSIGGWADKLYSPQGEMLRLQNEVANTNAVEIDKQAKKDRETQKAGGDPGVKNSVAIAQGQRNLAQTSDYLINKTMPKITSGMAALTDSVSDVTEIVGKLTGKKGTIGGSSNTTTPSNTSSATPTPTSAKTIAAESGGKNIANASGPGGTPTSSAYGVGQMLEGTFKDLAKKAAPSSALYGKTFEDMKKDVNLQIAATNQYEADNRVALTKVGLATTDTNLYLAHYLGTTGAIRLLRANDTDALSSAISAKAMESNPDLKYMATVGDLKKWAANKMSATNTAQTTTAKKQSAPAVNTVQTITAKKQSAAAGGILSGPKSGYQVSLNGTQAVVPLPDGKTIPVQIQGNKNQYEQINLLSIELNKLDSMLQVMNKQNDISRKILQRQV